MSNHNRFDLNPISTTFFSYRNGTLSAFASDLPDRGRFSQIYRDACDVGIAVKSHRTGRILTFAVHRTEIVNGDGIIWHLRPIDRNAPDLDMVIFND
jgi:hypothetical protein